MQGVVGMNVSRILAEYEVLEEVIEHLIEGSVGSHWSATDFDILDEFIGVSIYDRRFDDYESVQVPLELIQEAFDARNSQRYEKDIYQILEPFIDRLHQHFEEQKKAKEEAERIARAKREEQEKADVEARERKLYERLKEKYEGQS